MNDYLEANDQPVTCPKCGARADARKAVNTWECLSETCRYQFKVCTPDEADQREAALAAVRALVELNGQDGAGLSDYGDAVAVLEEHVGAIENALTPVPFDRAGDCWRVWQLAPESDDAERHIITSKDGNDEISGIVPLEEAENIVAAHNKAINALIAERDAMVKNAMPDFVEPPSGEGREMNAARANWAARALVQFANDTGLDVDSDQAETETAIHDLLCDLMHLIEARGFDPKEKIAAALKTFYAEGGS